MTDADGDPSPVSARDLALVAIHLALLPVAAFVAQRRWLGFARAALAPFGRVETPNVRKRRDDMRALLAGQTGLPPAEAIDREALALRVVQILETLAFWIPGRWRPALRLEGREHLDAALASGHGALLWIGPQMQAAFGTKRALADAGYAVHHVSSPYHGISQTRFGVACLNRIQVGAEARLVTERILKDSDAQLPATRAATQRLRENRIVSISSIPMGLRLVEVPMLSGRLRVSPGPASLSLATGAPLLPVFCEATGPDACTVRIEAPLEPPPGARERDAALAMARAFGRRIEAETRRDPASSLIWHHSGP